MSLAGAYYGSSPQILPDNVIEITRLDQIFDVLEPLTNKRIYAIFDWDNVISLRDGCDYPLRDGPLTNQVLNDLTNRGVLWSILTSRFGGNNDTTYPVSTYLNSRKNQAVEAKTQFDECIKGWVEHMTSYVPEILEQQELIFEGLNPPEVEQIKVFDTLEDTLLIYGNIIFGGSKRGPSNKGPVINRLISNGIIPNGSLVDNYIFVDNDYKHIQSVLETFDFMGLNDKLIAIYYPQFPHLKHDKSCQEFGIVKCLTK